MKAVVFIGMPENASLFLQLNTEPTLWTCASTYHIVDVPGGGLYARPLSPYQRDSGIEEAIASSDTIVILGPSSVNSELIKNSGKDVVDLRTIRAIPRKKKQLPVCKQSISMDSLSDVLPSLRKLKLRGCSFAISSDNAELNNLFSVLLDHENADFEISLCLDGKQSASEELFGRAINLSHSIVPNSRFARRLLKKYENENWQRNFKIHNVQSAKGVAELLYLTCTRKLLELPTDQASVLKRLQAGEKPVSSRESMELVWQLLSQEHLIAVRLEALMHTHMTKISNVDEVIISMLGSRKCNLHCAYCFSDHAQASPASLNQADMLTIIDLLISDRPGTKLKFDNNLGGEPLLDFKHVRERHALAIAYHKTRGIPCSFGLLTNGTSLSEKHLGWLRTHLPYTGFSLDGDEATHDKIRRDINGKATYKQTVRGIQMLQNSDWPVETGVSCVISKYNMDIKSLHEHMRDKLGIKHIIMKPVRAALEADFALTESDLEVLKENYHEFIESLTEAGLRGDLSPLLTTLQPLDYLGRFLLRTFWKDRLIVKRCGCGEHIFSVSDAGRVYPCDSFNGVQSVELANLQDGLHNRNNFRVPFVTEVVGAELNCRSCWARFLCGGVCQYVQYLNKNKDSSVIRMECGLAMFLIQESLMFWEQVERTWSSELITQVADYIELIGYQRVSDGSLVYAPC